MNLGQKLQIKDISIMKHICTICQEDFTAHSFNYVCTTLEGGNIYYTKISNASRYDDTAGIIIHCTNYLNYHNPAKWSWIIDFDEFGLKHTLGINTGIQLSRLINRFGRLNHLIMINTNIFVEQMLKMIKLTLDKEYHNCIRIVHPNDKFSKEVEQWTYPENNKELLTQIIHAPIHAPSSSNTQ
jgi:hypothetical protein